MGVTVELWTISNYSYQIIVCGNICCVIWSHLLTSSSCRCGNRVALAQFDVKFDHTTQLAQMWLWMKLVKFDKIPCISKEPQVLTKGKANMNNSALSHNESDANSTCAMYGGLHINIHAHYDDVIMSAIASQITSLTIVYSIVYSDADQRKHQSSASLAFV